MSSKIHTIIEELKALTLLEAAELVKKIESTFNVDASITTNTGVTADILNLKNDTEDIQEQTEFSIILQEVPQPKKISILKVIRSITGLGLKEAKNLVETFPRTLKENLPKNDVEDIKKQLEEAGAKVLIK